MNTLQPLNPTAVSGRTSADDYDAVHVRMLRFLPNLVANLGGDLSALLREAGIAHDALLSDASITYRQVVNLLESAATTLDCPDFGLRLAALQHGPGLSGPLGIAMQNARTFGEALSYVTSHTFAHSLAARIYQEHLPDGRILCGHDLLIDRIPNKAQVVELLLLLGHLRAIDLTGGQARVRQVHFRHEPISQPQVYRRNFGCEVRFGQVADGVVYSKEDLASAIVRSDVQDLTASSRRLHAEFTRYAPPLHAQVRGLILHTVHSKDRTYQQLAERLKMHPRTLHRRLRNEGTSFHKIVDEIKRDTALYYILETDFELSAISEILNFSEQSVLTRCCQRWFSSSPTDLRLRKIRKS